MKIWGIFRMIREIFMLLICCDVPIKLVYRHIIKDIWFVHPLGIVIASGAKIGKNAIIYQNVTIGSLKDGNNEYPVIGDNVHIYSGAVVVGKINIENNSVIGALQLVKRDIKENEIVK